MLQQQTSINLGSNPRFRVVSYNVLAELYATRQAYPYADPWALQWAYRRKLILQELEEAQGDIVCLQVGKQSSGLVRLRVCPPMLVLIYTILYL